MLGKIPFIADVIAARPEDRSGALWETIINLAVATASLWFVSFIMLFRDAEDSAVLSSFFQHLFKEISRGELFIVVMSLFAPVAYILYRDKVSDPPYPSKGASIIISLFCGLLAIGGFTASRIASPVNVSFVTWTSIVIFVVGGLIMFVAFVNRNFRENGAAHFMKQQEDSFVDQFAKRIDRGGP